MYAEDNVAIEPDCTSKQVLSVMENEPRTYLQRDTAQKLQPHPVNHAKAAFRPHIPAG
jgi:hypothetical protein